MNRTILNELGVFHPDGGVFNHINHCLTKKGSNQLESWILHPLKKVKQIHQRHEIVRFWASQAPITFEYVINNGTLTMVDDFLSNQENYNLKPNPFNIYITQKLQRWFKKASQNHLIFHFEYIHSLFSAVHQLNTIGQQFKSDSNEEWNTWQNDLLKILKHPIAEQLLKPISTFSLLDKSTLLYQFKRTGKQVLYQAMEAFAVWDAWQSLAYLSKEFKWVFPTIVESASPVLSMEKVYFPAIEEPVPFDLEFKPSERFLLLTGANMSGKSTLLRTIGVVYVLAQLGAPLPAQEATLSPINGIYTNLSVRDDIYRGESFFYAEVLRMKEAAKTIKSSSNYLFLMDELFKGTNFQDAFDSTRLIMEALAPYKDHLFVLSTHIYELAEQYQQKDYIKAVYMETLQDKMNGYQFTYQLKEGVSNDKIGSLILKKEGILEILKQSS